MNKVIKILSCISFVIMLVALLSYLTIILMQNTLIKIDFPEYKGGNGIVLPVASTIDFVGQFIAVIAFCIMHRKTNSSLLEILLIAILILVLPAASKIISLNEMHMVFSISSSEVQKYNIINSYCNISHSIAAIANGLILVVCGMNITNKNRH